MNLAWCLATTEPGLQSLRLSKVQVFCRTLCPLQILARSGACGSLQRHLDKRFSVRKEAFAQGRLHAAKSYGKVCSTA